MQRAYLNFLGLRIFLGSFFILLMSSNNITRIVRSLTTESKKLVTDCSKPFNALREICKIGNNSNDSFKLAANNTIC